MSGHRQPRPSNRSVPGPVPVTPNNHARVDLADVRAAALADLKRSGITDMPIKPSLTDFWGEAKPNYEILYFDVNGKPLSYSRLRYLFALFPSKFGEQHDETTDPKYMQPTGSSNHAYFPPCVKWPKVLADVSQRLLMTEGEKKSYACCKHGIACIGLGGAYGWKVAGKEELLSELDAIAYEGRSVTVVCDSDATTNWQVRKAAEDLCQLLKAKGAHVRLVVLPALGESKTGLDDFLIAKGAALAELVDKAEPWRITSILIHEPLDRAVEKAELILADNPEHKLYRRGSSLVRIVEESGNPTPEADVPRRKGRRYLAKKDATCLDVRVRGSELVGAGEEVRSPKAKPAFHRPVGNTFLAPADATCLEFILTKAKCVFRKDRDTGELVPADPKLKWCEHVVARMTSMPDLVPWKRLDGITTVPLLLADGSVIDQPGYHAETAVWFDPREHNFPAIPARPTKRQARAALDLYAKVFGKFPFAATKGQAWNASPSYAAVLSAAMSVLLRHLLSTVPLLAVTAPEPGSGKTKLAETIGYATTGCLLPRISYDNTEEFDKTLPIPLVAGDRIILIDNVDRKMVNSARLSAVLSTDAPVKWRVLGETRDQTILNRSVFIVTGNALIISGDLPRRSLQCRLTPNVAVPEARVFDFDPVQRARGMFPELAIAALTAARYYLQAKCPAPRYANDVLASGSLDEWNRIVRGLLVHLGFGDPLATQKEVRADNPMLEQDIELAQALRQDFGAEEWAVRSIGNKDGSKAAALLVGPDGKWDAQKAGYRIRGLRDRILEGLKVEVAKTYGGAVYYRVVGTPSEVSRWDGKKKKAKEVLTVKKKPKFT